MNTLDTSLRCLRHPASIASVGLLVLNDWVFKAAAPSWVTGKLSDFAGLFFFPFVVAAVLAPLLDRRGVAAHEARRLAFGLTALAFALIKTMPWANTLSVEILSHILGGPPQIVRDPTDLIALLALWPAARLWNECANAGPSRVGWVMLVLASVASLATSPPREARVEALAVENGVLYARVDPWAAPKPTYDDFFVSRDEWRSWDETPIVPADVRDVLLADRDSPLVVCEAENSALCYRITGQEQIERTQDGGESWRVVWSESHRRLFLKRSRAVLAPGSIWDERLIPLDLVLVSRDTGTTLVAAVGSEGLRIREPDGTWERSGVANAQPAPYAAANLIEALNLTGIEMTAGLVLALLTLQFIGSVAADLGRIGASAPEEHDAGLLPATRRRFKLKAAYRVPVLLVWLGVTLWAAREFHILSLLSAQSLGPLVLVVGVVSATRAPFSSKQEGNADRLASMARELRRVKVIAALGIFPGAYFPFLLWAFGVIGADRLPWAISLLVSAFILAWTVRRLDEIVREV